MRSERPTGGLSPDARLCPMVDANLVAFARHIAASVHEGSAAIDDPRSGAGTGWDPAWTLAAATAFLGRHGHGYGLWTRAHADAALEAVLPAAGFTLDLELPVMVLDERPAPVPAPAGVAIRQVVDDAGVEDFRAAGRAALGSPDDGRSAMDAAVADPGCLLHPAVAAFVAHVDGVPAAAAMSFTALGVARVGWVVTLPAFRRRGLGAAVTRAAVMAGFDRGASLAALEASPAAVALYRSLGFREITTYRVWSIRNREAPVTEPQLE